MIILDFINNSLLFIWRLMLRERSTLDAAMQRPGWRKEHFAALILIWGFLLISIINLPQKNYTYLFPILWPLLSIPGILILHLLFATPVFIHHLREKNGAWLDIVPYALVEQSTLYSIKILLLPLALISAKEGSFLLVLLGAILSLIDFALTILTNFYFFTWYKRIYGVSTGRGLLYILESWVVIFIVSYLSIQTFP